MGGVSIGLAKTTDVQQTTVICTQCKNNKRGQYNKIMWPPKAEELSWIQGDHKVTRSAQQLLCVQKILLKILLYCQEYHHCWQTLKFHDITLGLISPSLTAKQLLCWSHMSAERTPWNHPVTTFIYLENHLYSMTFHKWLPPSILYPSLFVLQWFQRTLHFIMRGIKRVIATFAHNCIDSGV